MYFMEKSNNNVASLKDRVCDFSPHRTQLNLLETKQNQKKKITPCIHMR